MEPASGVILRFDPALFLQLCTGDFINLGRLGFSSSVGCHFNLQNFERCAVAPCPLQGCWDSVPSTVQWRAASVSHLPLRLVLPSLDLVFVELHIVAPAYVLLGPQPLKPVCNAHTCSMLLFPGSLEMLSSVVIHGHGYAARCVLWRQAVLLVRAPGMQPVTCKDLQ